MNVQDIMTRTVITVTPDTSIQRLAWIMRENQISGLPVVNPQGQLVGVVTERDLIARHAPAREPNYYPLLWGLIPLRLDNYSRYREQVRHILAVNAEQLMTREVTTVSPEDTLEHVAELMMRPGHNTLPVLENDRLIGIVTRTDLVRMLEELEMTPE